MTAKKTTKTKQDAAAKISGAAAKVNELKAELMAQADDLIASAKESAAGAAAAKKFSIRKTALMVLLLFLAGVGTRTLLEKAHDGFVNWKQTVIQRLIPTPPNPFEKRERRTRPDRNDGDGDDRGIIWRFTRGVGGSGSLASWVKKNVPAGVSASSVYDVADAFYDAADTIEKSPAIDEPAEAVAAVRQRLVFAADAGWAEFLGGLDRQANTFGVESIADVIEFYYAVGSALYDAVSAKAEPLEAVSAVSEPSAEPEPGQEPPSDPAALPEPAEPDAAEPAEPETPAKECPSGQCPNQAPRTGYGYGNYGWRWY